MTEGTIDYSTTIDALFDRSVVESSGGFNQNRCGGLKFWNCVGEQEYTWHEWSRNRQVQNQIKAEMVAVFLQFLIFYSFFISIWNYSGEGEVKSEVRGRR